MAYEMSEDDRELIENNSDAMIELNFTNAQGTQQRIVRVSTAWSAMQDIQRPALIAHLRKMLNEGLTRHDIQQSMKDLSTLHKQAYQLRESGQHGRSAQSGVARDLVYFTGPGRTAFRWLPPAYRSRLIKQAGDMLDASDATPLLLTVARKALDAFEQLVPVDFTEDEREEFGGILDESPNDHEIKLELWRLLLSIDYMEDFEITALLERTERLLASSTSYEMRLVCLSLALSAKPRHRFELGDLGMLDDFQHDMERQWRIDGVLGVHAPDKVEELPEDYERPEHDHAETEIVAGFSTEPVKFGSFDAAKRFLEQSRRQLDITEDDVHELCNNKTAAVERVVDAFLRVDKLPQPDEQSEAEAKKANMQKQWRNFLAKLGDDDAAQRIISANAHMLVKAIIDLHLHGDKLFGYMITGNSEDKRFSAMERLERVIEAMIDDKKICTNILRPQGNDYIIALVAQPSKYYDTKRVWKKNNERRARKLKELKEAAGVPQDKSTAQNEQRGSEQSSGGSASSRAVDGNTVTSPLDAGGSALHTTGSRGTKRPASDGIENTAEATSSPSSKKTQTSIY